MSGYFSGNVVSRICLVSLSGEGLRGFISSGCYLPGVWCVEIDAAAARSAAGCFAALSRLKMGRMRLSLSPW